MYVCIVIYIDKWCFVYNVIWMCRWEILLCIQRCFLSRMDSSHQHWKPREPSWRDTLEIRSTSCMPKLKCEWERFLVDTQRTRTLLNLHACWRMGTVLFIINMFMYFRTQWKLSSRKIGFSPPGDAKGGHKHFMSPAVCELRIQEMMTNPGECLRPVNALCCNNYIPTEHTLKSVFSLLWLCRTKWHTGKPTYLCLQVKAEIFNPFEM